MNIIKKMCKYGAYKHETFDAYHTGFPANQKLLFLKNLAGGDF